MSASFSINGIMLSSIYLMKGIPTCNLLEADIFEEKAEIDGEVQ